MDELARSLRISIGHRSWGSTPIERNEYEEEINYLAKTIPLYDSDEHNRYKFGNDANGIIGIEDIFEKILKTNENKDDIAKDGCNYNFLGYFNKENEFQCLFISFGVEKEIFKYLICNFSIQDYQLKHFLQDLYTTYSNHRLSLSMYKRKGMEEFCDKYLMTLSEQEIKETEGYYTIV
jgi:hypothetical protein